MKKLIFLLFIIIPAVCTGQTEGKWSQRQDFHGGTQIGDSVAGSYIGTIDSAIVDVDDTLRFYSNGKEFTIGRLGSGSNLNSGSGITIDGSNNIDWSGALDAPATITGTEVYYLDIKMSDASDRSVRLIFRPADGLGVWAYVNDDHTGDSTGIIVDSNRVTISQYTSGSSKNILLDANTAGILITDAIDGVGIIAAEDYTDGSTPLTYMNRQYIDETLGAQDLSPEVYSPQATDHQKILMYDSNGHYLGQDHYQLQATTPANESAGIGVRAMDTILFSNTTADTIVTIPVGTVIDRILVYIGTTFNGSGTDLLDVGISTDGDLFENDLDMSDGSFDFYELSDIPYRSPSTVYVTRQYTDSGADASTGFAIIYVYYTRF
jgi:hypothetical protein